MVVANILAGTIHERCARPPNSPTIVGSAVDTIVWSSDASSITSMSAPKINRMEGGGVASGAARAKLASRMQTTPHHYSGSPNASFHRDETTCSRIEHE